jgi:hypothetical protein
MATSAPSKEYDIRDRGKPERLKVGSRWILVVRRCRTEGYFEKRAAAVLTKVSIKAMSLMLMGC